MSIDLDLHCHICLLAKPWVVELSTCTGVGGWGCLISASVLRNATPSFVLLNSALHSAAAAKDITFLMMIDVMSIAPLLTSGLFEDLSPR
jgi:hypothetical protein